MATKLLNKTLAPKTELESRWAALRSNRRAMASVRFTVEWEDGGAKQQANGVTVDVSRTGCMAIVAGDLPLHKRVRLTHIENGKSADGEVVWRGHEGWDLGIELTPANESFWGVKI
jgi:PilZ domain